MESPIPEEEEEESDYRLPDTFCRKETKCAAASQRVILHLDMDCFYAQVEMIRNPQLRGKPLGVQQKSLLVTCNYEARRLGVGKCMTLQEAKETCPQLVLVSGEDLTHYREMSYKVTELLEEFSPKVERLGFDENYVDITELVDKKLQEPNDGSLEVAGHVYNNQVVDGSDWRHGRLVAGSRVAADIRAAVHSRLGLTGCGGIATNKLLAKLVSGTYKPNQQTVLFPESSSHLINSLSHVSKIPGIGHKTAQRLEGLGLSGVCALQTCPITVLEKEFGTSVAHRIQQLSRGEDDSPVTPTGAPQSISEEDSFRKCCSVSEVRLKLEELLTNLLSRMHVDGRSPHTLRLSLRQSSATNKYWNRESRQCPIPKHLIQNLRSENTHPALMELLMKLFEKMIDVRLPFNLTVLNVCFSNLKAAQASSSSRSSIGFYLTDKRLSSTQSSQVDSAPRGEEIPGGTSSSVSDKPTLVEDGRSSSLALPHDIDMEVFSQLPEDIRREIFSSPQTGRTAKTKPTKRPSPRGIQNFFVRTDTKDPQRGEEILASVIPAQGLLNPSTRTPNCLSPNKGLETVGHLGSSSSGVGGHIMGRESLYSNAHTAMDSAPPSHCEDSSILPSNVDVNIFSQLPPELQKELMTEWKNKKLTPKMAIKKSAEKVKSSRGTRRPHSSTKPTTMANNLMNYFKPS